MEISELNPNFGRSRWHVMAQCFYCCYCDILVAVKYRELDSIKQYGPLEGSLEEWQKAIDVYKKPNETGQFIGFRQALHQHCLSIINHTDKALLLEIKKRNLNNQPIPQRSEKRLLVIERMAQLPRDAECLRCQAYFRENYLGYAFKEGQSTRYIHADCYQIMLDYQEEAKKSTSL